MICSLCSVMYIYVCMYDILFWAHCLTAVVLLRVVQ